MNIKRKVHPRKYAEPKVALSLGIWSGDYLFVSGAVAFDPITGEIVGDNVEEQSTQTLSNIEAVLIEAGLGFDDVVQARAYLTDIKRDFSTFDSVYGIYFTEPYPTRTTIGVDLAIPGLLVEIDVVAQARS